MSVKNAKRDVKFYDQFDKRSGASIQIPLAHKKVHEGLAFATVFGKYESDDGEDGLGAGEEKKIAIKTGDDPIHLALRSVEIDTSELKITLQEETTFDPDAQDDEDQLKTWALNREDVRDPGIEFWDADPGEDGDTVGLLPNRIRGHAAGGPAAGKTPMAERDEYQWILKPNTKYGLVLENTGGEIIKFLEVVWVWYRENG